MSSTSSPYSPLERTRDVYEILPGYPKPPLVPLPPPDDLSSLQLLGLHLGPAGQRAALKLLNIIGFSSFREQLPVHLETLLRQTNFRLPGLFAPVIAATAALQDDQRDLSLVQRAATLLLAAHDLRADVFSGQLPPDTLQGQPLEMGQYANFFSTSLVIEDGRARVFKSTRFSQVTVMIGGRLYLLDLFGDGANAAPSLSHIVATLAALLQQADADMQERHAPAVGWLTAASDRTQLRAFRRLAAVETNASNLDALRHSLLTLCLEPDVSPPSPVEAARLAHSSNLHNRWFHSSLQLVVFGNARACAINNFTLYLDGNTMMRGCAELQRRAAALPLADLATPTTALAVPKPRTLHWDVDQQVLEAAQRDVQPLLDEQTATFDLDGYGAQFFASRGILAVPAIVLALQMTVKGLTGSIPQVDQFLTMSKYRCMDLAVAGVTTPEVIRFVDYISTPPFAHDQARDLMHAALASQVHAMRAARQYLGLDMLLGLHVRATRGLRRRLLVLLGAVIFILLRILGLFKPQRGDILASHPEVYPEVPVIGRPGIRLPYVKHFGLHYQIFPDKTVVTPMPGLHWQVPNADLCADLKHSLDQLAAFSPISGEESPRASGTSDALAE